MPDLRSVLRPSVWVFYGVFVLEILFMISPAALSPALLTEEELHLAAKCGVCRLELHHLDNLLVRHELHKAAMVRLSVRCPSLRRENGTC